MLEKIKNYFKRNPYFVVTLLLSLVLLWPLFYSSYFYHQDDVQVIRLYEMNKCIEDGQIPCRWVPDLGGGFGYPLFNYYAPLPYYTGEVFVLLTHNFTFSAKMMFALSFIGSFLFMYLLGRKLWGDLGGSITALFYAYAPYHALNFYVRGAMGELWAMMFFPAILWALIRLAEKSNLKNSLFLGLFIALLLLSHNLSAMIFIPIVLVAMGILYFYYKHLSFLFYALISLTFGIFLSAFYVFPVLVEKDYTHIETTTVGYFTYTEHFKGLRKLFLDTNWEYGQSVREIPGGERDSMSYQIGWMQIIGWLLGIGSTLILIFNKSLKIENKRLFVSIVILSSVSVVISIFMIHPTSYFVWNLLEPLKFLQFPWRFLILITFFTSLVSGAVFLLPMTGKLKIALWVLMAATVVYVNLGYFKPSHFLDNGDSQYLTGSEFERLKMRSIYDYLPISAQAAPASNATFDFEILTGRSDVYDFQKGSDWFNFRANTFTHSIIRISQYYFPNWEIMVDGHKATVEHQNPLGLMTIILGEGPHTVEARLHNTPVRNVANLISLLTIIVFSILMLISFKATRKQIKYYLKEFHR